MIGRVTEYIYISPVMSYPRILLVFLCVAVFVCCQAPVQPEDRGQLIRAVSFSYDQDLATLFFSTKLRNSFSGFVQVLWFATNGLDYPDPDSIYLNDSGQSGDILAQDHTYSRKEFLTNLRNPLVYGDTGNVYLSVVATTYDSVQYSVSDSFSLGNIKPTFVTIDTPDVWFDAPDSLNKPNSVDTTFNYTIRAKAIDANGMDDIESVGFRWRSLSDGQLLHNGEYNYLYDDGSVATSGDSAAGDSIFSGRISIDFYETTGLIGWEFRVTDKLKEYRDTTHTVLILD